MGKIHHDWRQIRTQDRYLSAYRIRMTPGFGKALTSNADKSAQLSPIAWDLLLALRGVEATASLPHTVITHLKHFADGFQRDTPTDTNRIVNFITSELFKVVRVDVATRHQIAAKCLELAGRNDRAYKAATAVTVPLEELWRQYSSATAFQIALADSQTLGLNAVANAYESFVIRCIQVALARQQYRRKGEDKFKSDFVQVFGQKCYEICWDSIELKLLRALRNAISHNGCRVTTELSDLQHPFTVEKDVLQLGPLHLRHSLRLVEQAAMGCVDAALTKPAFKRKSR